MLRGNDVVEVLELRVSYTDHLVNVISIKSFNNSDDLLKIKQTFILGGLTVKAVFGTTTIDELYKYQVSYDIFEPMMKELEEKLFTKTESFSLNSATNYKLKAQFNIQKQTFNIIIEDSIFRYKITDVLSPRVYDFRRRIAPTEIQEASLAFYESGIEYPYNLLQHFKFKN